MQGLLVKTSLVDFPSLVSSVFFVKGCNLRCPYCYNVPLVEQKDYKPNNDFITEEDFLAHLQKRKSVLRGAVISGGEPLLQDELPSLIKKIKELGYKIKLDTNGMFPEKLNSLLQNKDTAPDFISLDVKTSPNRYSFLFPKNAPKEQIQNAEKNIIRSIKILSSFPCEKIEFRTVLVPFLITKEDINIISNILPKNALWNFSSFLNKDCLDLSFTKKIPYTIEEEKILVAMAKEKIPQTHLRSLSSSL